MNRLRLCQLVGALLVLVGLKFSLIGNHAFESPYLDAWDNEGLLTIGPALRGELSWNSFFAPANEHHPVWTRAINLGLTLVNGQWDNRLAATVNVLLPLLLAGWLLHRFGRKLGYVGWSITAGLLVTGWSLPFVWENALFGFQSCFHLSLLFGVAYLDGALTRPVGTPLWWTAQACAAAALFTLASSFLAPATVVLVLGCTALRERRLDRAMLTPLAWAAGWMIAGLLLINPTPQHNVLRAADAQEFFTALSRNLAWPLPHSWAALLMVAPFVWWVATTLRRKPFLAEPTDRLLFALGSWHLIQSAAIAFARGNEAVSMAVRYFDLHVLGMAVTAICMAQLWVGENRAAIPGSIRQGLLTVVIAWLALCRQIFVLFFSWLALVWRTFTQVWVRSALLVLCGAWLGLILYHGYILQRETEAGFLVPMQKVWQAQIQKVQSYLASGNADPLNGLNPGDLPHPKAAVIKETLQQPGMRAYLPANIRPPVALAMDPTQSHGFTLNPLGEGRPAWSAAGHGKQPALFVSEPMAAAELLPFLRFRVQGAVGCAQAPLQITDAAGEVQSVYHNLADTSTTWRQITLSSPNQIFRLRVELPAGIRGGLSAPVETGWATWLTGKLLKTSSWLFTGGALLWLVTGLIEAARSGRSPQKTSAKQPG